MAEIILFVNTFQDENDGSEEVGTGLSLREAILRANEDPDNEYTVYLPEGNYNLTIPNVLAPPTDESVDEDTLFRSRLGTGDLDVTGNVTIIGASIKENSGVTTITPSDPSKTIINAGSLTNNPSGLGDRVFDVLSSTRSLKNSNGNLTLQNVTLQNGAITEKNIDVIYQEGTQNGGAINIETGASLTLINTIVEDSTTFADGGAINNDGTLVIEQSIIRGNVSEGQAGAIFSNGDLTINNSIIDSNNSGDNGGGIYNDFDGELRVYNSAVINNIADAAAPEIIEGGGGGILNQGVLIVVNTTISGNRSASGTNQQGPGDGGGGILSRGVTRIINSTIVNNFAQVGSGIYSETTDANTILFNTIVGNNEGSPDLDGFFDPRSAYNLVTNGNGQGILDKVNFNIVGGTGTEITRLLLDDLSYENGGFTPTHALLEGSVAIDNGNNEINGQLLEEIELYFPTLINGQAIDQRLTETRETTREEIKDINNVPLIKITTTTTKTGLVRTVDGNNDDRIFTDIGAYEFDSQEITETVVTLEYQDLDGNIVQNPDLGDDNETNSGLQNETNSGDSLLNTPLYRLQNTQKQGTYLYANETETNTALNLYRNFVNEGLAFNIGLTPNDDLIALYRFHNEDVPGTYLYVGEEEKRSVEQNYKNFELEGLAFYAYGADANKGQDIYRLHNNSQPGTYLFVGETEKDQILNTYTNFKLDGVAFEAHF